MTVNFLPGQPNDHPSSCSFTNWNTIQILTYTSGNNLVILTKNSTHLQTIYLPSDSFIVDVNKVNGKIAICVGKKIVVYTPEVTNYFNFNFHGRKNLEELKVEWKLEHTIENKIDDSTINCISWSDYTLSIDTDSEEKFLDLPQEFNSKTACELIVGSDKSLTLHSIYYTKDTNGFEISKCTLVWHKLQPNPVYKASFSPNASCIASIGYYDRNVKLWHRTGFTKDYVDFELHYISHDTYVTDLIWKTHPSLTDPNNKDLSDNFSLTPPPESFILKPVNTIIKNETKFLSSRSSSIGAHSRKNQHNVLYTFTSNSILRVYSTFRSEKGFCIFESGKLDLFREDPLKRNQGVVKSCVFIDNETFELGMEKVLRSLEQGKLPYQRHFYNKISELMKLKCELCMVIGNDGEINFYALTNLCNPMPTLMSVQPLNNIYVDKRCYCAKIKLRKYCLPTNNKSYFLKGIQYDHYSDYALTLVIHDTFKNTIREVEFKFEEILRFGSPSLSKELDPEIQTKEVEIGHLKEKFTGHNKSVKKLIRSDDGSTILSISRFDENYIWRPIELNNDRVTISKSLFLTESPIIDAVIWNNGNFVFTMLENKLVAYSICQRKDVANVGYEIADIVVGSDSTDPECLFILPETPSNCCHIITIMKDASFKSYEFKIESDETYSFKDSSRRPLPIQDKEELHVISVINPVGWETSIEMIGRDVFATISKTGLVSIYYASFENHEIEWHLKDSFRTGISNCSFISGSSINQMAIVDETCTKLSIWNMKIGVLDYYEEFKNEIIKDLDWTSTKYKQGILAVGFRNTALLFTQLRYDYTNRTDSFAKIKKIDISSETDHEIGDSIWMRDGLLVTGAGNQLYLSDKKLDLNHDLITRQAVGTLEISSNDIFHLCSALNGPLPLYHPQFIIQLLFSGKYLMIKEILLRLSTVVREIDLGIRKENDFRMGIDVEKLLNSIWIKQKNENRSINDVNLFDPSEEALFNEQASDILSEKLKKIKLPLLTGHQQITLSHTVDIMKDILLQYSKVLDYNGLRFYLTMRLFTVNMSKDLKKGNNSETIRNRDVMFALHSDNRDLLYDIILQDANGTINWKVAKRYLLPYWMDRMALIKMIEKIAVNEFMEFQHENDGRKDPTSCSIFYLILKKKNVLLGLWKNSFGHPEREKMVKFLSNDFNEKRWRTAALKNAYVLLGKHRYKDAVSFFLLADSPKDAVNVIIKNLNDLPLAIAVSRCYEENDSNDSMKSMIERTILNEAIMNNDRWKISWIFWILGDKPNSAQSLIKPLHLIKDDIANLLPNFKWPNIESVIRTGNTEDPVLLVMYRLLKSRKIDYYHGISQMDPKHEFSFIIKAATMYSKMGCDWIAYDLVSNWEFTLNEVKTNIVNHRDETVRKKPGDILSKFMSSGTPSNRSFSSLLDKTRRGGILDEYKDTKPVFKKSLLDSYEQPKSMLDGFTDSPMQKSIFNNVIDSSNVELKMAVEQPSSIFDDFAEPPKENVKQTKSMLDDFTSTPKPANSGPKIAKVNNMLDNWM